LLLHHHGKRLHIRASIMTTYIRPCGTDPPILSILSSFGDESHNKTHSSTTTAPSTNDKSNS
jgi:hypothetical protein